jgi:hypothetical protein
MKRKVKINPMYECRCDGRLQGKKFTRLSYTVCDDDMYYSQVKSSSFACISLSVLVLFIIRVKRELKRVYRNGCRYNERLILV